jgi:hypothetical protein
MAGKTNSSQQYRVQDNLLVGEPQVEPDAPAHSPGIRQGNSMGGLKRARGIVPIDEWTARGTAERSTGINARARNPIDPRSPNLSPP